MPDGAAGFARPLFVDYGVDGGFGRPAGQRVRMLPGTGAGGAGDVCGGMYTFCKCADRYVWKDGACVCDETCSVGNILYSDYSCNSCVIEGKTPIGIISYASGSTRLAVNLVETNLPWGDQNIDVEGIVNYTESTAARTDFNGKQNTLAWISEYGDDNVSYAHGYAITIQQKEPVREIGICLLLVNYQMRLEAIIHMLTKLYHCLEKKL